MWVQDSNTSAEVLVKARILVVDDDEDMQTLLDKILSKDGHQVTICSSAIKALSILGIGEAASGTHLADNFDLILSDINMPLMDGIKFVEAVKDVHKDLPIIMITAYGSIESAVAAMRKGAYDYLTKPLKIDDLRATIKRTLEFRNLEQENILLRKEMKKVWSIGDMIGKSQSMQLVFDLVRRVSQVNSNVLILGESGTGKEMVARAIHNEGVRAGKPFVAINCAAIPENLLESELFGHAKGSFTGAIAQKRGLFEEANGGTIFLDEIGEMDGSLQAKLLRVIQERKVKPVGQNTMKSVDVRIIAATHRNLKEAIRQKKFREDLYYRLSVIPIGLPPLRERTGDIPLFVEHFLRKYSIANNSPARSISKVAMAKLMSQPWEGNVRQLENVIERAVILCDDSTVDVRHISFLDAPISKPNGTEAVESDTLSLREMEKRLLIQALKKAEGKKERAAKMLGISRKTFYRKEKEYLTQNEANSIPQ